MAKSYFKVTRTKSLSTIEVPCDPIEAEETGEAYKKVAKPGYLRFQEFFFFDDKDPDQIRHAFSKAEACLNKEGGKLCVYKRPKLDGAWDSLHYVGQFEEVF